MIFGPPSFVAQPLGMRFALLIDGVETGTGPVYGAWTLKGTVLAHAARSFAAPQPATDGRMTVTFSAGQEADVVLELTARIQGVTMYQLGISAQRRPSSAQPLTWA